MKNTKQACLLITLFLERVEFLEEQVALPLLILLNFKAMRLFIIRTLVIQTILSWPILLLISF